MPHVNANHMSSDMPYEMPKQATLHQLEGICKSGQSMVSTSLIFLVTTLITSRILIMDD